MVGSLTVDGEEFQGLVIVPPLMVEAVPLLNLLKVEYQREAGAMIVGGRRFGLASSPRGRGFDRLRASG